MGRPRMTAREFWAGLERTHSGCWLGRTVRPDGYSQTMWNYRTRYGHRVAWELTHGPIPPGMYIDHLCRNKACCNPAHLEPVTPQVNTIRAVPFRPPRRGGMKAACIKGHPLTPDNTYFRPSKPDARVCRECKRTQKRRYLMRKANS